jgi:hypothetical protein
VQGEAGHGGPGASPWMGQKQWLWPFPCLPYNTLRHNGHSLPIAECLCHQTSPQSSLVLASAMANKNMETDETGRSVRPPYCIEGGGGRCGRRPSGATGGVAPTGDQGRGVGSRDRGPPHAAGRVDSAPRLRLLLRERTLEGRRAKPGNGRHALHNSGGPSFGALVPVGSSAVNTAPPGGSPKNGPILTCAEGHRDKERSGKECK